MTNTTLSSQYQTRVPAEIRATLNLKPGEQLTWKLIRPDQGPARAEVIATTKTTLSQLKGIAQNVYPDNYLNTERSAWDQ